MLPRFMTGMFPAGQLLTDAMKTIDFEKECVSTGTQQAQLDYFLQ